MNYIGIIGYLRGTSRSSEYLRVKFLEERRSSRFSLPGLPQAISRELFILRGNTRCEHSGGKNEKLAQQVFGRTETHNAVLELLESF